MTIATGAILPTPCELVVPLSFPGRLDTPARIWSVEKFAGAAIGTALVTFPTLYADQVDAGYGQSAKLRIGNKYIFRGVLGTRPVSIDGGQDEVQLVLYDDKWRMGRRIIGQHGVGTLDADAGFPDVGHEIAFNPEGTPNKDPASLNFKTGSGAVLWTIKTALQFIFDQYIDDDCAKLLASDLDDDYDAVLVDVALVGQTALQAVDALVAMTGQSWGLRAEEGYSVFVPVKAGSGENPQQVKLVDPVNGFKITNASQLHASEVKVEASILDSRDLHQVRSGRVVIESTYSSAGATPMLTRQAGFVDAKFAARFVTDVTQYEANGLGRALSAGSPPLPWLAKLLTRWNATGSGFTTAAEILADPQLLTLPQVQIPVWVRLSETGAILPAMGGYEIDIEQGLLDFESEIDVIVYKENAEGELANQKVRVTVSDWSTFTVWITVATVTMEREFAETDEDSRYLPDDFCVFTDLSDLVPLKRFAVWLPDLSTADATDVAVVAAVVEEYYSVTDRLAEYAAASAAAAPKVESKITLRFPFLPIIEIGDRIELEGRELGQDDGEVVTSIVYDLHGTFETRVQATNVIGSVDAAVDRERAAS